MEVVGVIKDVKFRSLFEESRAFVYLPVAQFYMAQEMALYARTSGKPETPAAAIKREVSALDEGLRVYEVRTLSAQLDNALTPQRLAAMLISGFGLLALILPSMGLYGVMAYSVAQRMRELGIRVALGARAGDALRLVIGQGMKLALLGISIGLLGAYATTRMIRSLLFGMNAADPLTFAGTALLLMFVSLLSCWIPGRRATKVDPKIAIKYE
jgi:putative ABC transport system permease protein